MAEYRKSGQIDGFRRGSESKHICRSREPKQRYGARKHEAYYAEGQTTDCTKSSNEIRSLYTNKGLEQTIVQLKRENEDLKQTIVMLKTEQFMKISEDKLKNIIREHENLRQELKHSKQAVEELRLENSFLTRTNQTLKQQIEILSKQVKKIGHEHQVSTSRAYENRDHGAESFTSEVDDLCKSIYRNASTEVLESRGSRHRQKQDRSKTKRLPMPTQSDYYVIKRDKKKGWRQRL